MTNLPRERRQPQSRTRSHCPWCRRPFKAGEARRETFIGPLLNRRGELEDGGLVSLHPDCWRFVSKALRRPWERAA
jgi:hypothetical protein